MTDYQLLIITPYGKVFDGPINSLTGTGETGSFGILGQHAPMVISLQSGPLTIKQDGGESYFAMTSGVLEINDQSNCLLLADNAIKVKSLDEAKTTVTDFGKNNERD